MGTQPPSPIFGPCPLWPNGWIDQDSTWHRGGPWSRLHCAIDWDPAPLPKKGGGAPSSIFGSFLLSPNGWMHQDATRYAGRPQPRRFCVRWWPSHPLPKGGRAPSPILRVEVENFEIGPEVLALPVIANFVALEQQIILVKTRSELV